MIYCSIIIICREEVDCCFYRNIKITRTPTKNQQPDDKLDELIKMMKHLMRETQKLTAEAREIKKEQEENRKEIEGETGSD